MTITRFTFDKISVKVTKRWRDAETGKSRQETREFFQTVNPFNRGQDGLPKTREQILAEVNAEAKAWRDASPM